MKRITFILAVAAALCAFSSCKKNTDTGAQEVTIFGTWEMEKMITEYVIDYNGHKAGETKEKTMEESGYSVTIIFNEDYSYKMTVTMDGKDQVMSGKFTYDEATKVISISSGKEITKETVESLTATELQLKVEETAEGKLYAYQTTVCKRVK